MPARDELWIVEFGGNVTVARCTDAVGENWMVLGNKSPIASRTEGFCAIRKLDLDALLEIKSGEPTDMKALSNQELVDMMLAKTPLGEARRQFSYAVAAIEQANEARPLDIFRLRRMEFEAAQMVAKAAGVVL